MSEISAGAGASIRHDSGMAVILAAADWLHLAAAPAFAIMALLSAGHAGGQMAMICGTGQEASPFSGMVPMYLLMSAVHAAPWLRLISRRRGRAALG